MDGHLARLTLDLDTLPGQFIERLTVLFNRRVHRRDLLDITAKTCQHSLNFRLIERRDLAGFDDLAFRIGAAGAHAQFTGTQIDLVGIQQEGREFGRFTQTDRQHATSQGIEVTGVSGLGRIEKAFDLLQRSVGGDPDRFVQQQYTVYTTTACFMSTRH